MAYLKTPQLSAYPWWIRIIFWMQVKKYGRPLEPLLFWAKSPKAMHGFIKMYRFFVRKKSPLPADLQALVRVRVSQIFSCSYCVDLNLDQAHQLGISADKLEQLACFQNSSKFSEPEKDSLLFAENIVEAKHKSSAQNINLMQKHFGDNQITELTALISHQAMSCIFNSALGIEPHGFCKIEELS